MSRGDVYTITFYNGYLTTQIKNVMSKMNGTRINMKIIKLTYINDEY